jgi:hypothetical protein
MSKKMKRKYYREFLSYFRYLKLAGLIISGDFYKPGVKQMTQEISDVVNNLKTQGAALLKNVIDETERNLYSITKDYQETYVTNILKDFADIVPYLNYTAEKEYFNEFGKKVVKIGDKTFPGCIDDCHTLIVRHELKYTEHFDELTRPQQYLILCYRTYRDFFNRLDAMCIDLNLDLTKIQHKHKLIIWERDNDNLLSAGFTEVKIKSIEGDIVLDQSSPQNKDFKIPAKYYALYHWILIEMGIEKNFDQDSNDYYNRRQIEAFAYERYPKISKQGFYRTFIRIDITNKPYIAVIFGKGYKEKLIKISNNDAKVIRHLQNYPN